MPETVATLYRKQRKPFVQYTGETGPHYWTTPARYAISIARDELALRIAESEGRIRFEWEYDPDYEPELAGDDDESRKWLEHDRKMLESGSWEALRCIAYVRTTKQPHDCPSCECEPIETEENAASLWGIVVDIDDTHGYKREVERELASEAGVI